MPTLKAEFSGGGDGADGGVDGDNQEHTVILFNISYEAGKHDSDFLAKLKKGIIDKLLPDINKVEEAKEVDFQKFLENEIGYGISVAYEPPIPPTGRTKLKSYKKKTQYIGITLNLTQLMSKTQKEAKEIFEICRKYYDYANIQINKKK